MEKYNIEQFINFVLDLVTEFDELSKIRLSAKHYFMNGGCYELYQVIRHYFPEAICMINNDLDHCATMYKGKMYDATGERKDYAYFHVAEDWDIAYMERAFGRDIKELEYENISFEIDKCDITKKLVL